MNISIGIDKINLQNDVNVELKQTQVKINNVACCVEYKKLTFQL